MPRFLAHTLVFWCGATVVGFELAGARLLTSVFGTGEDVWASVIATTLGALALGSWAGGRIGDARRDAVSAGFILISAAALLLVISRLGNGIAAVPADLSVDSGAWYSSAAILAGPMLLLGMAPPVLARLLIRDRDRTGAVLGGLLACGSAGSVVGAGLAGMVLIPHLGCQRQS